MAAGLYDRAEDMFSQLTDEEDFRVSALQQLLVIHQATSDWQKQSMWRKSWSLGKEKQRVEIAHFIVNWRCRRWAATISIGR